MVVVRFSALLFVLLFGWVAGAHEGVPPVAECDGILTEPTGLPGNWALSPADFEAMIVAYPDLAPDLKVFARLAHFVDDPANAEFFDLLGAYSGVGLATSYYEHEVDYVANGDEHREDQLGIITEFARSLGLLPAHYGEAEATFFARSLGSLPVQNDFDHQRLFEYPNMVMAFRDYYLKKRPQGVPTMRQFALQSREAQRAFVDQAIRVERSTSYDLNQLTEKFSRRLLGKRVFEFEPETRLLDRVERALDGDAAEILRLNSVEFEQLTPRRLRETAARVAPIQFSLGTMLLLKNFGLFMESLIATNQQAFALRSPILIMVAFQQILEQDAFVDQGFAPFLRRLFAEVVLGSPTLSGAEAQRKVRTRLSRLFKDLNAAWRESQRARAHRAHTPPPSKSAGAPDEDGPTRDERIRQYAEQTRVRAMLSSADQTETKRVAARTAHPAAARAPEPELWADLLAKENQDWSIEEARARFARETPADTVLSLPIRRTGFTYRVELSEELIHQLLHPAAGEPEDLRIWLKALAHGPARSQRQNGWLKRNLPYGIYLWEIKVISSLYRILGYKTNEGTWRFERIALMH